MKIKQNNQKGFTIIEVLIVLAIAGLIMLVVFLAIPALQRNQRNGGRRTDASRIAAAANDFLTNANGLEPTTAPHATTIINSAGTLSNMGTLSGVAGAGCTAADFTAGNLTLCAAPAGTTTFTIPTTGDGVVVATKAQCSGTAGVTRGSDRQMAVIYTQETSNSAVYDSACLNI